MRRAVASVTLAVVVGVSAMTLALTGSCGTRTLADGGRDAPSADDGGSDADGCSPTAQLAKCSNCWIPVEAGSFVMGSPPTEWGRGLKDEEQVQVTLTYPFEVSRYETTQADWTALCVDNPSYIDARDHNGDGAGDGTDPRCPVGNVTWYEALEFSNRLSVAAGLAPCYVLSGCTSTLGHGLTCLNAVAVGTDLRDCKGYRLPTEAEWEYAARAGTTTAFYTGPNTAFATVFACDDDPNLDPAAWYCANSSWITQPVGLKQPNPWGLYDVLGNAKEWVNDAFHDYPTTPVTDPGMTLENGPPQIVQSVMRGGVVYSNNAWCRVANRSKVARGAPSAGGLGFRLVRSLK